MKQLTSHERSHCANCGTPMQGEFCHTCGQSIHSVLKPMRGLFAETVETVLGFDGRLVHTLPPLFLKPGFLTLEYFSGRRVRYVAPFRLMFTLCVLSFFVCHLVIDDLSGTAATSGQFAVTVKATPFDGITSPDEVRKELHSQLDGLQRARDVGVLPQVALKQIDNAGQEIRQKANQRLIALGAAPMPAASLAAPAAITTKPVGIPAGEAPDQADKPTPVHIAWLPDALNARLASLGRQIHNNKQALKHGDAATRAEAKRRIINGVFGVLPPIMLVLIPLFAALLKLFYVFRRRLYMEHLIVALQSHAFLFLGLLLIALIELLSSWSQLHAAWAGNALGWLRIALIVWIPTYLLIMQKRVYRQGWPMTLWKFWVTGWCYLWLLMVVLLIAALLGLAN